jgi:hypothetical protein
MILQWQILIIMSLMMICNPIQDFEGGGGVHTSFFQWSGEIGNY